MLPSDVWKLECLSPLREEINLFTKNALKDYIPRVDKLLKKDGWPQESMLFDTVWGNIEFTNAEIVLIDSPVFQRLRGVSQLGLASLLYPGATHNRFEHSLGVAHIAAKIFDRINKSNSITDKGYHESPELDLRSILRISSLFHDIGHVFFSHIGERFFKSDSYSESEKIRNIIFQFRRKISATLENGAYDLIKINEGELLSALILASPATKQLLELIVTLYGIKIRDAKNEADRIADLAACFIIGLPVSDKCAIIPQILSGSLDADKLDYLLRDSQRTGIPVVIDVDRIIAKLRIVEQEREVKTAVWTSLDVNSKPLTLALNFTAARTIDDVAQSRSIMQEKVYAHQKVLTAEAMFFEALHLLNISNSKIFASYDKIYSISESDFLTTDQEKSLSRFGKAEDTTLFKRGCKILSDIKNRNLINRCCVFSEEDLNDSDSSGNINTRSFIDSVFSQGSLESKEFIARIRKVAISLATSLEQHEKAEFLEDNLILLSAMPDPSNQDNQFSIITDTKIVQYQSLFKYNHWQSGRDSSMRQFYIFTSREVSELVYLACHSVMLLDENIKLNEDAYYKSKLNFTIYSNLIKKITNLESDDKYILAIRNLFIIDYIEEKYIHDKISEINSRLDGKHEIVKFTETTIKEFIAQVCRCGSNMVSPLELCEAMLSLLDDIKFIDRNIFSEHFKKQLSDNPNLISYNFVAVGSLKDSASHISYYLNDILPKIQPHPIDKLPGMLNKSPSKFVFYDDAFGSGKQLVGIFQELLDIPKTERILNENHTTVELNSTQKDNLKKSKLTFLFAYGKNENTAFINEEFDKLGFEISPQILISNEFPEPYFANVTSEADRRLKEILQDVGYELLRQKKATSNPPWEDEKLKEFSLGYNNAQLLVFFPWNTPSYTITALWCEGKYLGKPWKPLFARQSK